MFSTTFIRHRCVRLTSFQVSCGLYLDPESLQYDAGWFTKTPKHSARSSPLGSLTPLKGNLYFHGRIGESLPPHTVHHGGELRKGAESDTHAVAVPWLPLSRFQITLSLELQDSSCSLEARSAFYWVFNLAGLMTVNCLLKVSSTRTMCLIFQDSQRSPER